MKKILINNKKYLFYLEKQFHKIVVVLVIIALYSSVLHIDSSSAFYSDTETSNDNSFSATMFDIFLTKTIINKAIGPGLIDEIEFDTLLLKTSGSLKPQYKVYSEIIPDSSQEFCDAVNLKATRAGFSYDGPLLNFTSDTTTSLGTWEFDLELDKNKSDFPHGAKCNVDIVFDAWRDGIDTPEESGYTDIEKVEIRLDANMVVLNEFLPRPNGVAYGFDFGNDSSDMPQGEWVELYNNSDFPTDLTGWYIGDSSTNEVLVTATNTVPATTTIPAHGWLVVYMNQAVLNNNGDTVKLFDNADVLIDSYEYNSHDVCEIEPTPANPNEGSASTGVCSDVPPNKSYARIPDGVGSWVDPIPTPGEPNELLEIDTISIDVKEEVVSRDIITEDAGALKDESIDEVVDTVDNEVPPVTKPKEDDIEIKEEEIITTEELIHQEPIIEEVVGEIKEEEIIEIEEVIEEVVSEDVIEEAKEEEAPIAEPAKEESVEEVI